jgi:hypothetical protein
MAKGKQNLVRGTLAKRQSMRAGISLDRPGTRRSSAERLTELSCDRQLVYTFISDKLLLVVMYYCNVVTGLTYCTRPLDSMVGEPSRPDIIYLYHTLCVI